MVGLVKSSRGDRGGRETEGGGREGGDKLSSITSEVVKIRQIKTSPKFSTICTIYQILNTCVHSSDCTKLFPQVIQRASEGVLPATEHKWLGVSAYNLGLALFRGDLFGDAARVLELACDELVGWCEEGRSEEKEEEVRVCVCTHTCGKLQAC